MTLTNVQDALKIDLPITELTVKLRGEYPTGTLNGWNGEDGEVVEIFVDLLTDCRCDRPCCSGSYRETVCVGPEHIAVIYGEDGVIFEDEGYAAECEDEAQRRAEQRYMP